MSSRPQYGLTPTRSESTQNGNSLDMRHTIRGVEKAKWTHPHAPPGSTGVSLKLSRSKELRLCSAKVLPAWPAKHFIHYSIPGAVPNSPAPFTYLHVVRHIPDPTHQVGLNIWVLWLPGASCRSDQVQIKLQINVSRDLRCIVAKRCALWLAFRCRINR